MNTASNKDNILDWIDWRSNPKWKVDERFSHIDFLDDFFADEDAFVWPQLPALPKAYVSPQKVADDVLMVSSPDDLEKAISQAWWYVVNVRWKTASILSNADINNPEHLHHMDKTVPVVLDILSRATIALQEEWVSNIFKDNNSWESTLKFIETPDHYDIIDPISQEKLFTVSNIRIDWHFAVTSINVSDWVFDIIFNVEITESKSLDRPFNISCVATNFSWQALSIYKEFESSKDQDTAFLNMRTSKYKEVVFENFLFLLTTGYYNENLRVIFKN